MASGHNTCASHKPAKVSQVQDFSTVEQTYKNQTLKIKHVEDNRSILWFILKDADTGRKVLFTENVNKGKSTGKGKVETDNVFSWF